jgi:hypothetical protein
MPSVTKQDQLSKFLALMGPRQNVRAWGNEDDFGRNEEQASAPARTLPQNVMDTEPSPATVQDAAPDLTDAEWLRRRMKGNSNQEPSFDHSVRTGKLFEQSDNEDAAVDTEMTKPEPVPVCTFRTS